MATSASNHARTNWPINTPVDRLVTGLILSACTRHGRIAINSLWVSRPNRSLWKPFPTACSIANVWTGKEKPLKTVSLIVVVTDTPSKRGVNGRVRVSLQSQLSAAQDLIQAGRVNERVRVSLQSLVAVSDAVGLH